MLDSAFKFGYWLCTASSATKDKQSVSKTSCWTHLLHCDCRLDQLRRAPVADSKVSKEVVKKLTAGPDKVPTTDKSDSAPIVDTTKTTETTWGGPKG